MAAIPALLGGAPALELSTAALMQSNLRVLQRQDANIETIVESEPHVVVYQLDESTLEWVRAAVFGEVARALRRLLCSGRWACRGPFSFSRVASRRTTASSY